MRVATGLPAPRSTGPPGTVRSRTAWLSLCRSPASVRRTALQLYTNRSKTMDGLTPVSCVMCCERCSYTALQRNMSYPRIRDDLFEIYSIPHRIAPTLPTTAKLIIRECGPEAEPAVDAHTIRTAYIGRLIHSRRRISPRVSRGKAAFALQDHYRVYRRTHRREDTPLSPR